MTNKKQACPGQCGDLAQFDITMAFQPIIDVVARDVFSYEALVRGINGEGAGVVLSKVDETNRYAFDQACRVKAIELAAELGLDRHLSINFMPNAVYEPKACLKKTIDTAKRVNFPLDLITFEFTENEQIIDREHLVNIIETYREYGFQTAIDDFGAGYAGLSLLADFETDKLKIDMSLIKDIDKDVKRQAILCGILKTAEVLKLDVICEGIETVEQYRYLKEIGVRYMQGFLFSKPKIEELPKMSDVFLPED